jgi:hypothetical protein
MIEGLSAENTKAGRLQRACLALLGEHEADGAIPTSIRFLFYELVSRGDIPKDYRGADGKKKARTPSQDVADAVKVLREAGIVPWRYIVDETRSLNAWHCAQSVYEYVEDMLPSARMDPWEGEPPPLILCESRSLAGVLRHLARDYLCPIAATNGQAGGFLHTTIGPLVEEPGLDGEGSGPRRVFYLGDLDLSGGHIEENTRSVLEDYAEVHWQRLAITDVQVRDENLLAVDKKDHRFKPARIFSAVETEALRQQEIQRILLRTLDEAVPHPLAEIREHEERQRAKVREVLAPLLNEDETN